MFYKKLFNQFEYTLKLNMVNLLNDFQKINKSF